MRCVHLVTALAVSLTLSVGIPKALMAQETVGKFGLEISSGVIGVDNFNFTEFVFAVKPKVFAIGRPDCWWTDPPPPECFERPIFVRIEFPIIIKPFPEPDPWVGLLPGFDFQVSELEVGPAVFVAPDLELIFLPASRVRPSIFAGGGFVWEGGQDTEIAGIGTFTTESNLAPLVTFGAGLDFSLGGRASLTTEARFLTVFYSEMTILGPSGGGIIVSGDTMLSEVLTAGVEFAF